MVRQERIHKRPIVRKTDGTQEQQFPVMGQPDSRPQPQSDDLQRKVAAIISEVAGERRPHQVISNEELWRQNVQEVGE